MKWPKKIDFNFSAEVDVKAIDTLFWEHMS
jgi:hypothetical protein